MSVRVSVVIPVYNAGPWLAAAVDSVYAQTYQPTEVIVVDDGSTDGCCDRLIGRPGLRLIRQKNGGVAKARNAGVAQAGEADFIAFLDQDDSWAPTKLERQIDAIETSALVAVGALMWYVSPSGKRVGITGQSPDPLPQQEIARARLMPFPISSLLVRNSALKEVGGFDDSLPQDLGFDHVSDLDLMARLARVGPIGIIREPMGSYRVASSTATVTRMREMHVATRWLQDRYGDTDHAVAADPRSYARNFRFTLNERRLLIARSAYRSTGLAVAEGRFGAAIAHGVTAVLASPRYAVLRARRQASS